MIRTRDFLLFISIVIFLSLGISWTLLRDTASSSGGDGQVMFVSSDTETTGFAENKELDRQSIIERLRSKIASSDLVITPAPSVTEETSENGVETVTTQDGASLMRCAEPDDALSIVPKWPINEVTIAVREGSRLLYTEEEVVVTASGATSSAAIETTETITKPLLQLPLQPQASTEEHCVPSEVVGVSQKGLLVFNRDMRAYRNTAENTLIGYARDGFPIYGVYEGEVDQCGGYEHETGYRYTVSAERDYIVGCFVGAPATFTLE